MYIPNILPTIEFLRASASSPPPALISIADINASCNDLDHCRTLLQILWSCTSVLVTCAWVSIHPNLPARNDPCWKIFLRKVGLMLTILIAPVFLVGWAFRQWYEAWSLHKEFKNRGWTKTHGFFAAMGGFMLYEGKTPICVLRYSYSTSNSGSDPPLGATFGDYADVIGQVPEGEIRDRSHSDGLSKLIVLCQTSWFVFQLISRRLESLPITALEIMTAAFAAISLLIYGFWWNKPQGVRHHIRVQRRADADIKYGAALMAEDDSASETTVGTKESPCNAFRQAVHSSHKWFAAVVQLERSRTRSSADSQETLLEGDATHRIPPLQSWNLKERGKKLYSSTQAALHSSCCWLSQVIVDPERLLPFYGVTSHSGEKISSFEKIDELQPPRSGNMIMAVAVPILFGAIHCVAWDAAFPSEAERTLWRGCAVAVTFEPMVVLCCRLVNPAGLGGIIELFVSLIYLLARITLLGLAFAALRASPSGVFETVRWTTLIPHI